MSSREKILAAVAASKPKASPLPDIESFKEISYEDELHKFEGVLTAIGGTMYRVNNWNEIKGIISEKFNLKAIRVLSLIPELDEIATSAYDINPCAHELADVDLSIVKAHFAVAENGAVWITEELVGHRAVPFICQHLAAVITMPNLVATMHNAYEKMGNIEYGWGAFIAGPSKTADIEQSLVLGAHGPRSMTVFVLSEKPTNLVRIMV